MIPPITDDDLHAYVDGHLDAARHRQVEDYLAQHSDQDERVRAWQAQRGWVHSVFDPIAAAPLPPELTMAHLREAAARRPSWRASNWRIAAGFLVALSIGGALGWYGRGPFIGNIAASPTGIAALKLETDAAYQVFAPGHVPVVLDAGQGAFAKTLSHAVGFAVIVPDLRGSGYHLVGASVMATTHGPGAILVYGGRKTRLVVLIRKMDVAAASGRMAKSRVGRNTLFTWINDGIGFGVSSDIDPDILHPIANHIRDAEARL